MPAAASPLLIQPYCVLPIADHCSHVIVSVFAHKPTGSWAARGPGVNPAFTRYWLWALRQRTVHSLPQFPYLALRGDKTGLGQFSHVRCPGPGQAGRKSPLLSPVFVIAT